MGLFSFLSSNSQKSKRSAANRNKASLQLEALEDRVVPSANTISGFVYHDLNDNGVREPGENPIVASQIELRDATGAVVATDITDANGRYEFTRDQRVDPATQTISHTIIFPETRTNFVLSDVVPQFDSSLGTLESVRILHEGTIISEIQVENTSPESSSSIEATVEGTLTLQGGGVTNGLAISENAGQFHATVYDGATDFDGQSGHTFGPQTGTKLDEITLTGPQMQPFIGVGTVTLTETATASSFAKGGGNLTASLQSRADAKVTVIYTYNPDVCLHPGDYTIVQVTQPSGFDDGQESREGIPLNNPPGVDVIPITLSNFDLHNNNFGEIKLVDISGFVFEDNNNSGNFQSGPPNFESGIGGVAIQLSGADSAGPVAMTAITSADGAYSFTGLRPGTYAVNESQPATYLDGKDYIGNLPGTTTDDSFGIQILSGQQSTNNNFGELKAAEISGFVFEDNNNQNNFEFGPPGFESGIGGVQIVLTGSDDTGSVSRQATTLGDGSFRFTDLRPGTYTISEVQPATHLDGQDYIGNISGVTGSDTFGNITLQTGDKSQNNNFGELKPASLSGYVFEDDNDDGTKDPGEAGINGVTVTLTGFNDLGPVNISMPTGANLQSDGFYAFDNLRPGTYTLRESQPLAYDDGKDHLGSLSGIMSDDFFSQIVVVAGASGEHYDFGEIVRTSSDLSVVKSTTPPTALVGGQLTYTLTVTNLGVDPAENVVVTDTLPPEATYIGSTAPGWSTALNGNILTFNAPTLQMGEVRTITIAVQAPLVVGMLTNTAEVTSDTPDPIPQNNISTVTNLVINQPGETFPDSITPFATTFTTTTPPPLQPLQIISKDNLFLWDGQMPAQSTAVTTASQSQQMPLTSSQTYLDGIHRAIFGRGIDSNTQVQWGLQLDSGALTREQAIINFWWNAEHRTNQVNSLYQTFLSRNPTNAELNDFVQRLNAGAEETDLAIELMASTEYQAMHPTTAALLAGYYQDVTGQIPDVASLQLQAQSLSATPVEDVARLIMNSDAGLREIVDRGFRNVLQRDALDWEIQYYSQQIRTGQLSASGFMRDLLAGQEFYLLAFEMRVG